MQRAEHLESIVPWRIEAPTIKNTLRYQHATVGAHDTRKVLVFVHTRVLWHSDVALTHGARVLATPTVLARFFLNSTLRVPLEILCLRRETFRVSCVMLPLDPLSGSFPIFPLLRSRPQHHTIRW